MLNLDTDVPLAAVGGRLLPDEQRLLDRDAWCISDIVIWEIALLSREGRIPLTLNHPNLNRLLREMTIWPITRAVGLAIARLDSARTRPARSLRRRVSRTTCRC